MLASLIQLLLNIIFINGWVRISIDHQVQWHPSSRIDAQETPWHPFAVP